MRIEPYDARHLDAIVRLSLQAWTPVFESLRQSMDSDIYAEFFPDWRVSQEKSVRETCAAADTIVAVAVESSVTLGFVAVRLHSESKLGEIQMIAVDPDFQRRGIAAALTEFAVDRMAEAGMSIAMVETGGDSGHRPARLTYEKLGFSHLPIARYFRKL